MKALVVRQPWIDLILSGQKTWEMRSYFSWHRGVTGLIEKGTGTVVGTANFCDALERLSSEELEATYEYHRIPKGELRQALDKNWVFPWVLQDAKPLVHPVPYKHTSGGSWVTLTDHETDAVRAAMQG